MPAFDALRAASAPCPSWACCCLLPPRKAVALCPVICTAPPLRPTCSAAMPLSSRSKWWGGALASRSAWKRVNSLANMPSCTSHSLNCPSLMVPAVGEARRVQECASHL